jgi:hypothetical protein
LEELTEVALGTQVQRIAQCQINLQTSEGKVVDREHWGNYLDLYWANQIYQKEFFQK